MSLLRANFKCNTVILDAMEVKNILDYLNHYFKTKSCQSLVEDPSIGGPELNNLEYCSYFAILSSFSRYYTQQLIIGRYFPEATIVEPPEESSNPFDEYDDLPPDEMETFSDFG